MLSWYPGHDASKMASTDGRLSQTELTSRCLLERPLKNYTIKVIKNGETIEVSSVIYMRQEKLSFRFASKSMYKKEVEVINQESRSLIGREKKWACLK